MDIQTVILIILGILILIVAFILLLGARARRRLKAKYPPPGRMVDLGGYRIHLQASSEGSPAVILESGQGDIGLSWAKVQPEVAKFTRVCSYDRAGLGWSEASPRPRSLQDMADELHLLLQRAGVPAPYVLVGASAGGPIVRLFAAKHPQEVAGIVLVDAAHEEQFTPAPIQEAMQRMSKMMPFMMGGISALVRSGLAALNPNMLPDLSGARSLLPPPQAEAYTARIVAEQQHIQTSSAELKLLESSYARMRAEKLKDLGDLPLMVLRHGKPQPMMASPEVTALLEETFQTLQEEMVTYSTQGRLVVAERSGHAIHLEQPELVVDAIREVVSTARERLSAGIVSTDGRKG